MNATAVRSLAFAALATVIGHVADAQLPAPLRIATAAPEESPQWSSSLTSADRKRLSGIMRRADTLVLESKHVEASRLYWSVVSEQRAAEEYPKDVLRRLVLMYFEVGDEYAAASALAELAESASAFGDPVTRLQSLFEAALIFRDAGRQDRVSDCVRQIGPLLKSAAIPEAMRADIASRIVVR